MIRSWGVITLGAASQPCFSDVTTAAIAATDGSMPIIVPVASTARYEAGDRIVLEPGTTNSDILLVQGVVPGGTTKLVCNSEGDVPTKAHASGVIVQLNIACSEILLTALSTNSGPLWLGSDSTVTNTGGGSGFTFITASGNYNLGFPQWNAIRTSEAWMVGTSGDKFGVAAIVV